MKYILKTEEMAMALVSAYYLYTLDLGISKWWYLLLFFAPDTGMIGYVWNNKAGAFVYNLFHHKAAAILVFASGFILQNTLLVFTGCLLFSHASFDRALGFGLKYTTGFKHTHLQSPA